MCGIVNMLYCVQFYFWDKFLAHTYFCLFRELDDQWKQLYLFFEALNNQVKDNLSKGVVEHVIQSNLLQNGCIVSSI